MEPNRPRYRRDYSPQPSRKKNVRQTLLAQSIVCVIIAAAAFGIRSIPAMDGLSQNIKSCLYYTVDYQATIQSIWNTIKQLPQQWNQGTEDNDHNEPTSITKTTI